MPRRKAARPAEKPATKPAKKRAKKPARRPAKQPRRRRRLTGDALRAHAALVERRLVAEYPDAHCELDYHTPFELAVATVLSAQCTDKQVNVVTPGLFRRWPDASSLSEAPVGEIEVVIRSTGFFRNKAKSLSGLSRAVMKEHGGTLPSTMTELVALPGIGRKTANVILGNAFGRNEGIVVDTHVARLAARFGFTRETDPVRIEQALLPLFERSSWTRLSHLMIWHGRRICAARKPRCSECVLSDICPSSLA